MRLGLDDLEENEGHTTAHEVEIRFGRKSRHRDELIRSFRDAERETM
jgi:hypothetical protein